MHLKRSKAPLFWRVPRKEDKWSVSPGSGPHSFSRSIPLGVVIRDHLKMVSALREAKKVLNEGKILVNGIARKDYRYPIGPLDLITITDTKESYRVNPSHLGFVFEQTKDTDTLSRIINKVAVSKGKIQYTTSNGLTLVADNKYKVGDTLKLDPKNKVKSHIPLAQGSTAIIIDGKLRGTTGKISTIGKQIKLDTGDGQVETIKDYIFVTGEK